LKLLSICRENEAVASALTTDITLVREVSIFLHDIAITHESVALNIISNDSLCEIYKKVHAYKERLFDLAKKYRKVAIVILSKPAVLADLIGNFNNLNELAKLYPEYQSLLNNPTASSREQAYIEWQQLMQGKIPANTGVVSATPTTTETSLIDKTNLVAARIYELFTLLNLNHADLIMLCEKNGQIALAVMDDDRLVKIIGCVYLNSLARDNRSLALKIFTNKRLWKFTYIGSLSFGKRQLIEMIKRYPELAGLIFNAPELVEILTGKALCKLVSDPNLGNLQTFIAENPALLNKLRAYTKMQQAVLYDSVSSESVETQEESAPSNPAEEDYRAGLGLLKSAPRSAAVFFALAAKEGHSEALRELKKLAEQPNSDDYKVAIAKVYTDRKCSFYDAAAAVGYLRVLASRGKLIAIETLEHILADEILQAYDIGKLEEVIHGPYQVCLEGIANIETPNSLEQVSKNSAREALIKLYQLIAQQFYKLEEYTEAQSYDNRVLNHKQPAAWLFTAALHIKADIKDNDKLLGCLNKASTCIQQATPERELFLDAINEHGPTAILQLGLNYLRRYPQGQVALCLFQQAAVQGHALAQSYLRTISTNQLTSVQVVLDELLHHALKLRSPIEVRYLLGSGANINSNSRQLLLASADILAALQEDKLYSLIEKAVTTGDEDILGLLLKNRPELFNATCFYQLLNKAARAGQANILTRLLEGKQEIEFLLLALESDDDVLARALIARGCRLEGKGDIHLFAANRQQLRHKIFLNQVDLIKKLNLSDFKALLVNAVLADDSILVEQLCKTRPSDTGYQPDYSLLDLALDHQCFEVAKCLSTHGISIKKPVNSYYQLAKNENKNNYAKIVDIMANVAKNEKEACHKQFERFFDRPAELKSTQKYLDFKHDSANQYLSKVLGKDYSDKKANLKVVKSLFANTSGKKTIAHQQEVFSLLQSKLDYINQHKNPIWDWFLGKRYTASWQKAWGKIRQNALDTLMEEMNKLETTEDKINHLEWARELELFKLHRYNWGWGRNTTVKTIDAKLEELKQLDNPKSSCWCF
jgi:hypothetical protein